MITIVVKEPGKEAYSKEIEDNLEEYQKIVGTTGAEFRSLLPTEIEKAIERLNGYAVEA